MSGIEMQFFGHYYDVNDDHTHDKIWGWFTVNDQIYSFWGPRREQPQFLKFKKFDTSSNYKLMISKNEVTKLAKNKSKKGYTPISLANNQGDYPHIENIYPGFIQHLKMKYIIVKMSNF
jgi:hypothetical protein